MQYASFLYVKGSRAARIKDRVQPAAHKRSDPDGILVLVACWVVVVVAAVVVLAVVGQEELRARLARKTFKALNSWPSPVFPSYVFCVQRVPQAVPLSPPEHCFAAPCAEL